ncbi:MAG: DUF4079 domain-containing protein [Desulfarculus sp.]|nr:DUF4079 domain-containing protein [Desulfarculus sp.]
MALSFYVLLLGWRRFGMVHLGRAGLTFAWKRHVSLGGLTIGIWLAGICLGLGVSWWTWKVVFITNGHYQVGLAMLPLMVFGLASGRVMDRRKARRRLLPLAHGLNNLVLVALALVQLATGIGVIRDMILP